MSPAELVARRGLYVRRAEDMLQPFPEVAESLQAQIVELHCHPSPERAERLAFELDGIRRQVLRVRQCLLDEAAAGGSPIP